MAEKKAEEMTKAERLKSMMSNVNKKFGKQVLDTFTNHVKAGRMRKTTIPTPSLELNAALYCGGFKGIVELYGGNSSGKTSLAIDTIVKSQKDDPDFYCGWLETEGSITKEILEDHGVDLSRILYWRQEDTGNAENALDVLRAVVASGDVNMVVVNSIAGLAPATEVEDDLNKQNIALTARLLSKFFRVEIGESSKNDVTIVFINQTRDKVGVMFGNPETTTGGNALGFYASQRIRMSMLKLQDKDPITADQGVKIGFSIKKNRFAGTHNPFTKGEYYAMYGTGIDSTISMPQMLLDKGVVRQAGAYWYYEDANGKPIVIDGIEGKFKSKKEFLTTLSTNKAWKDEMLSKISFGSESQSEEEIKDALNENKQNEAAAIQAESTITGLEETS